MHKKTVGQSIKTGCFVSTIYNEYNNNIIVANYYK